MAFLALASYGQRWEYFTNFHDPKQIIEHEGMVFVSSSSGIISIDPTSDSQGWFNPYNSNLPEGRAVLGRDEQGALWASYLNSMWKFDQGSWQRADSLSTVPGQMPQFHFLFTNGELWYATSQGVMRRSGGQVFAYSGPNSPVPSPTYFVNGIVAGSNGAVWVATNLGLLRYQMGAWSVWDTDNSTIESNYITEIDTDSNGVWIRSGSGIQHFDGTIMDQTFTSSNSPIISTLVVGMAVAQNGRLFIAMRSGVLSGATAPCNYCTGGMLEYSNGSFSRYDDTNSGIHSPSLSTVFCADNGHIYCTSSNGYLFDFSDGSWADHFLGNSPISSTNVRLVMKGHGKSLLWLVDEYDPWFNSYRIWQYASDCTWNDVYRSQWIVGATEDADGAIYVRTNDRIVKVRDGVIVDSLMLSGPQPQTLEVDYTEIAVDQSGGLWFDAYAYTTYDQSNTPTVHEGLRHVVGGVSTIFNEQNSPLQGLSVKSVQVDEQNGIWVLTSAGVFKYKDNTWTSWLNWTPAFANKPAWGLSVYNSKNVWVKYYNGVAHIRGDSIQNFDLTGIGEFGGARALEDSLMYLFNNIDYVSSYNYSQTVLLDDTSGYWLSPANTHSQVALDGSIWFGNHSGVYHYIPAGTDECTDSSMPDGWLIYPNPVGSNTLFIVGVEPNTEADIEVYSINGRLVRSMRQRTGSDHYLRFYLQTDILAKGMYTICLRQNGRMVSGQFIRQ